MSIDRHWGLSITPLSPVHLGSGQDYEPTGYVIDDGALHEFDGIAALQALPDQERAKLGRILEGRPTQDMLRQVQTFFHGNRERLIAVSRRCVRVNPSVEAFYKERVGKVVQREERGREVQNRLEIERTAFNPCSGAPILPGSGIKGAIRTALLDRENDGRALPPGLKGDRGANLKLQQRLFQYRPGKFELDPMRLIRISDAMANDPEATVTQVRFAVNRKKTEVRVGGKLVDSQAEQRGLYQLLECLSPLQARGFRAQLSIQATGGVASNHWPDANLRFDAQSIAAACNRFYLPALERERKRLRERGFLDDQWEDAIGTLLSGPLSQTLFENRAFLLRVGRHSGAESVTLNGVRDIKIMKGKGEKPEYLNHAKTLWLAADERLAQRGLLPFGWLLLEIHGADEEPATITFPQPIDDFDAWRADVAARREGLVADLAAARARAAKAEQERLDAERAEAERAERLAQMTDEARKLESLRELFARDRAANRKDKGGELAGCLAEALKEAEAGWQGQDCVELADLALEIYGFIGWPASKKKRERQELVNRIRAKSGA
ncbi:CRISPR-associated protein Csm5 [Thiorhodococcus mannitoliphagus]|uniref:CRISPR system Cms protein Csm5 n=1 Tax=Thiorhodococcus mannitoliphagus TaxID=329406 RepID=A0A6P1E1R3_9GAMM|nr:RAMP superfamily CRISPR-associated protein [Thiorhodococcus mannitoliphagus]NEX22442.1 CRISPR-associated protein Csm5 [Thiorhodococcus mannitoliphagus]